MVEIKERLKIGDIALIYRKSPSEDEMPMNWKLGFTITDTIRQGICLIKRTVGNGTNRIKNKVKKYLTAECGGIIIIKSNQ